MTHLPSKAVHWQRVSAARVRATKLLFQEICRFGQRFVNLISHLRHA
jgi:hypothetical protein